MPAGFGRRGERREVDVRGDVLRAGTLQPRRDGRRRLRPLIVCRANVVSVPAACATEYSSRASWP